MITITSAQRLSFCASIGVIVAWRVLLYLSTRQLNMLAHFPFAHLTLLWIPFSKFWYIAQPHSYAWMLFCGCHLCYILLFRPWSIRSVVTWMHVTRIAHLIDYIHHIVKRRAPISIGHDSASPGFLNIPVTRNAQLGCDSVFVNLHTHISDLTFNTHSATLELLPLCPFIFIHLRAQRAPSMDKHARLPC